MEIDREALSHLGVKVPNGFDPRYVLGQGGGGIVIRGKLKGADGDVGYKIPHRGGEGAARNEQKILKRLQGMSGVPRIISHAGDGLCFAIVDGRTMNDYLENEFVTLSAALQLIAAVSDVLSTIHGRNVVHRDVKFENVLVPWKDVRKPTLIDFGSGVDLKDAARSSIGVSGTPVYMAPEAFFPTRPHPSQDVYALGIMLYRVCTGTFPFVGENIMQVCSGHTTKEVPNLPSEYPSRLNDLVLSALEKHASRRLQDAKMFAMTLREAIAEMSESLQVQRVLPYLPRPDMSRSVTAMEFGV